MVSALLLDSVTGGVETCPGEDVQGVGFLWWSCSSKIHLVVKYIVSNILVNDLSE